MSRLRFAIAAKKAFGDVDLLRTLPGSFGDALVRMGSFGEVLWVGSFGEVLSVGSFGEALSVDVVHERAAAPGRSSTKGSVSNVGHSHPSMASFEGRAFERDAHAD
jgi:hypothetical protein